MEDKSETVFLQTASEREESSRSGNRSSSDDYDPHEHRQVEKPTNNFETLVHLLKCSLGTGILAMPQAFARAGLITGIVSTIIVAIIITYCLHILVRSQYEMCKRLRVPLLPYAESMTEILRVGPPSLRPFASLAACLVDLFLIVYQLGICCVYIVFLGSSLQTIFHNYIDMSVEVWMLVSLVPLIAFNLIRNLKVLAPWSSVANLTTFVGIAIVLYLLMTEKRSSEPLDLWGSIYTYPLYFGTILFALTAVGVVIALENNMKTPKSFGKPLGVLNVGMTIIVLLYLTVGVIGYVFCVSSCADTITLNLPQDGVAMIVKVMFLVAIFISYGLQCYVPVEVVWNRYLKPKLLSDPSVTRNLLGWEYGLRIALCLLTFIVAVSVPRLGLFISLFGAFCLSALGICFPAIMEICVSYPDKFGFMKLRLYKDIFLFIFGIVGLVVGTYTALAAIVRSFE